MLTNSMLSKQRKIKELEHVVDSWIEDIRQEFLRIIEQYAVPIIKKHSEDISKELHKAFLNSVANGWQEAQIEDLIREIKLYEEELTEYRKGMSAC